MMMRSSSYRLNGSSKTGVLAASGLLRNSRRIRRLDLERRRNCPSIPLTFLLLISFGIGLVGINVLHQFTSMVLSTSANHLSLSHEENFMISSSSNRSSDGHRLALARAVSIIVPTYQEAENIRPLCQRVFESCSNGRLQCELVIVDDNSNDGTDLVVRTLIDIEGFDVNLIVRKTERGLSSAVIAGFNAAKYDTMVVLDADLSHPPEVIPDIVEPIITGRADFSIGSRYVNGGHIPGWTRVRRIISHGATLLAWPLAPYVRDPMSGYFALRRSTYDAGAQYLNPMGFKIGLELLVKCPNIRHVKEVPITFKDRAAGQSKLKLKTQVLYLRQLAGLYMFSFPVAFFSIVLWIGSLSGVFLLIIIEYLRAAGLGYDSISTSEKDFSA